MVGIDVAPWLASLPLAPEFHPSEEEFVDPIAYILKIEEEASQYGICKIVPPYSRAPENMVLSNLNASLTVTQDATAAAATAPGSCSIYPAAAPPPLARSMCSAVGGEGDPRVVMPQTVDSPAKFTTRRQQLGWNPRRPRGGSQYRAQKLVWESGEYYTLEQFEDKAKDFSSTTLGSACDDLSPLAVETLFWNAEFSKPISIEYANDIPGSAFLDSGAGAFQGEDGRKLVSSGWNIRNIARSHGSLLKFMPDEVPGVTTPMVYLGMLFSWFAWHVEDHELHSLNYLHTGARKTWYAVPSDAACALEEVIRVYGYGSRLKPRAAFTLLGEKTTVLSPEVLVAAGVPCCRLVQNPGEYVITFPRAYHLGFSHGFNCGEAANFATPAWLEVAREAAARRASMSHLPMLSHEQLLYLFTMSLAKSPSSPQLQLSTFKVENAVKEAFVNEVKQNNTVITKLLEFGVEGCIFLREIKTLGIRPQTTTTTMITSPAPVPNSSDGETQQMSQSDTGSLHAEKNNFKPFCVESKAFSPDRYENANDTSRIAPLPTPWGALPCAACGILCFASMALVQPTAAPTFSYRQRRQPQKCRTSQAAPSQPSSLVEVSDVPKVDSESMQKNLPRFSGICQLNSAHEEPDAGDCDLLPEVSSLSDDNMPDSEALQKLLKVRTRLTRPSLELLAEMYKDDLKEDIEQCGPDVPPDAVISTDEVGTSVDAPWLALRDEPCVADLDQELQNQAMVEAGSGRPLSAIFVSKGLWFGEEPKEELDILLDRVDTASTTTTNCDTETPIARAPVCSFNCESNNIFSTNELEEDCSVAETEAGNPHLCSNNEADVDKTIGSWKFSRGSARPYVFCLEHAVDAMTKLQPLGGATVLVICHPNYGTIQRKAEDLGQEIGASFNWEQIPLREASEAEVEIVNKAIHLKIDNSLGWNWCAKMGIGTRRTRKGSTGIVNSEVQEDRKTEAENLSVESEISLTAKHEVEKKMIWCGRQWKASQVHPLLGGGKSAAHLLSQVLRIQKRLQPAMKIRNSFAGLRSSQPLKKLRKDGWEQQERVMTAAILRKSKRNAVAREGRRKRIKFDGLQARLQQAQHGVCKQAVFSLECNSSGNQQNDEASTKNQQEWQLTTCETSFNPASSSTGCQRNSDFDSSELVKWHDVPVSCSPSLGPPMQAYEWSSDISLTGICSTSQQDTGFDEVQEWDQRPADRARKLVARLKRRCGDGHTLVLSKKARIECVENSDELNSLMEYIPDSISGLIAADCTYANESEEDGNDDEIVVDESASDIDEYSLKTGSGSDSSPPKALPCFAASRKRSSSKSRVKRATWENLLNRLAAPPPKDEEVALIQNQDSFPLSCVTETGWEGIECGTYRAKKSETPQGGKKRGGGGGKRAKAAATAGGGAGGGTAAAGGNGGVVAADEMDDANNPFPCDIEGCTMSFSSEPELAQHKKNKCTFKGCGKRFFSHKYLVQHRRVHMDERPLKCPWQGCTMSFKWAWARTEHIRVHTGERPYSCPECDKTFRFVSDFSRHKRNTGHARA